MLALSISAHANAVDLTAYTEEWPPYNYRDKEKGEMRGLSTDMLRALCAEARLKCDFRLVPWARAYRTAQQTPGTLVYTTARKPSRESDFLWLGPIVGRTTWLYVRSSLDEGARAASDLSGLRIGVVRDEASIADLNAMGVSSSALSAQANNNDVLRLLQMGALDAMVDTELGMAWNLQSMGMSPQVVSRRFKVSDAGAYYFALNPKTNPAIVQRLQQAYQKLQRQGRLDRMVHAYVDGKQPH